MPETDTAPLERIVPTGNKILVKRDKGKETSAGGIILTGSLKDPPYIGTVIAVGPGRLPHDQPLRVVANTTMEGAQISQVITEVIPVSPPFSIGERVLFQSYAGSEVKDPASNDDLLLLDAQDIIAKLERVSA